MNLIKSLIEIQNDLKAPKDHKNTFGKYNYRTCESILNASKPLLHKHKLYLKLSDEVVQIGERFYVKATACLTDGENSECATAFAREPISFKGMSEGQLSGATSSYARKYALCGLFAIDDSKDDPDSKDNSGESERIKKEQYQTELKKACKEMTLCSDLESAKNIWSKYKVFQKESSFIEAKNSLK